VKVLPRKYLGVNVAGLKKIKKIKPPQNRLVRDRDSNSVPPSFGLKPWRWTQYVSPKRWYLPTSPHSVTTQKTNIDIFTAVRTSHFMKDAHPGTRPAPNVRFALIHDIHPKDGYWNVCQNGRIQQTTGLKPDSRYYALKLQDKNFRTCKTWSLP
jgi:hypothetical protein